MMKWKPTSPVHRLDGAPKISINDFAVSWRSQKKLPGKPYPAKSKTKMS
jgi:hypothetical protein